MKAVAFVCLLSLSLCLGLPTAQPEVHATQGAISVKPEEKPAAAPVQPQEKPAQPASTEVITIVTTSTEKPTHSTEKASPPATPNETKPAETKPVDNKTDKIPEQKDAPKPNESKPTDPPKNDTNKEKPTEGAKAGDKEVVPTTHKAVTGKPTEAPKDTTEKPLVTARGFDGPSFIGGIILTLGLLAIGFMGFKYYKNQTERNYHTL